MAHDPNSDRPRIWAEGDQKPSFNIKAFGGASLVLARNDMAKLLSFSGRYLGNGGAAVIAGWGRIPPHRLTRVKRFLPSHTSVGRAIFGVGNLLSGSAQSILPNHIRAAQAEESIAPATAFTSSPAKANQSAHEPPPQDATEDELIALFADPAPAATLAAPEPAPAASYTASDPDLAAIRSMMFDDPPEGASPPKPRARTVKNPSPPEKTVMMQAEEPETAPVKGSAIGQLVAFLIGHGLWGIAIPFGAAHAGIAHLSGKDLAEIAKDE